MNTFDEQLTYKNSLVFFDGLSLIREFESSTGDVVAYGYMLPGKFVWKADLIETFNIINGEAIFIFDNHEVKIGPNDVVSIPQNTVFEVHVKTMLDYRCDFD